VNLSLVSVAVTCAARAERARQTKFTNATRCSSIRYAYRPPPAAAAAAAAPAAASAASAASVATDAVAPAALVRTRTSVPWWRWVGKGTAAAVGPAAAPEAEAGEAGKSATAAAAVAPAAPAPAASAPAVVAPAVAPAAPAVPAAPAAARPYAWAAARASTPRLAWTCWVAGAW